MNEFSFFAPIVVAAALSYFLTPLSGKVAIRLGAVDEPGPRKIHHAPIPRLGGLAVVSSVAVVLLYLTYAGEPFLKTADQSLAMCLGLLPVLAISIIDDVRPIAARTKLMMQILGAGTAVALGIVLQPQIHLFGTAIHIGWLAVPLSVLWLIGVTNAFNLIDGLDGLSAGLALISAGSLAIVFVIVGEPIMARTAMILVGALIGFLPYNVYPARIFLGDSGAASIGFALACFALKGGSTLSAGFATLLPLLILGVPVVDTLVSVARRVARGNHSASAVLEPDRDHIHHRLLALGLDHRRAVLTLYGAGAICGMVTLVSLILSTREAGLMLVGLVFAGGIGVARLGYDEFALIKNGLVLGFYDRPVLKRSFFVVFVDLAIIAVATYLAVGLRSDEWSIPALRTRVAPMFSALAPSVVVSFWAWGLYRGAWKLAGVDDCVRAGWAVATGTMAALVITEFASPRGASAPTFAIYGLLHLFMAVGARMSYRVLAQHRWWAANAGTPVVIYGAGVCGIAALKELMSNLDAGLRPVGFIDDDEQKRRTVVNRLPVLGSSDDCETIISRYGIRAVVVASRSIPSDRLERVRTVCRQSSVPLMVMYMAMDVLSSEPESAEVSAALAHWQSPVAFAPPASRTLSKGRALRDAS